MNQNFLRGPSACFGVRKIIDVTLVDGNVKDCKVEWKPSWVDGSYLHGCETLLEEFLKQRVIQEENCQGLGNQKRSYEYLKTEVIEQVDEISNGDSVNRITSFVPPDEMSNDDSANRITSFVPPDKISNDDSANRIISFVPPDEMSNDDNASRTTSFVPPDEMSNDDNNANRTTSFVPDEINEKDNTPAMICRNFANAMTSSLSSEDVSPNTDVTECSNNINEQDKTTNEDIIVVVKEECLDDDGIEIELQVNDNLQYETNCLHNDSDNDIYQMIGSTDAHTSVLVGNKHCIAMRDCSEVDRRLESSFCDVMVNQCSFCEKVFNSNEDLVTHELSHIQTKSKIRSSKELKSMVMEKRKQKEEMKCSTCTKVFQSEKGLKVHESNHFNHERHSCTICAKTFSFRHSVTRHIREAHQKERRGCPPRVMCPHCNVIISNKQNLKKHILNMHTWQSTFEM